MCSCKPQAAHAILNEPGLKQALDQKLLISILAGVTIAQLEDWVLPGTRVVRAMPNTPCRVWIQAAEKLSADCSVRSAKA
jgi:pyrroline-5-carboxylate reductase